MGSLTNFSDCPDVGKERSSRSPRLGRMGYLLNMLFFLGISGISDSVEVAKPSPQPHFAPQHPPLKIHHSEEWFI